MQTKVNLKSHLKQGEEKHNNSPSNTEHTGYDAAGATLSPALSLPCWSPPAGLTTRRHGTLGGRPGGWQTPGALEAQHMPAPITNRHSHPASSDLVFILSARRSQTASGFWKPPTSPTPLSAMMDSGPQKRAASEAPDTSQ